MKQQEYFQKTHRAGGRRGCVRILRFNIYQYFNISRNISIKINIFKLTEPAREERRGCENTKIVLQQPDELIKETAFINILK